MENEKFLPVVLIIIGALNFVLIIKFIRDEEFARNYIAKSPKAFLLRKIFGEEKAYQLTKKVFIPLGICLSIFLIIIGLILTIMKI